MLMKGFTDEFNASYENINFTKNKIVLDLTLGPFYDIQPIFFHSASAFLMASAILSNKAASYGVKK